MIKTLIIFTPGFPKDENDSTCLPPQQIFIRALNKLDKDLNLIILSFQYPFSPLPYYWNGIKVIPFNGRNRAKLPRIWVWLKVFMTLKKLRNQNDIIGILSFWCTECAFLGKYLGKHFFIKHHCWILGQDAKKENKYVRMICPVPEDLIAMSEFLQKEFHQNHGIKPRYVIQNGVDQSMFPVRILQRDIDILGVGSLITLKQFDVFIKVVSKVKPEFISIKTLIAGKGPEEKHLASMINKLHLKDAVTLAGEQPHNEVLKLMGRSRILLHTSAYEGFSTVCLEALFAGAHVVSFCSPIAGITSHWHIVQSEEEMLEKVLELLHSAHLDHSPQLAFSMTDSAKAVLRLYT